MSVVTPCQALVSVVISRKLAGEHEADGRELNMCETFGVHSSLLYRGGLALSQCEVGYRETAVGQLTALKPWPVLETRPPSAVSAYYCLTFPRGL